MATQEYQRRVLRGPVKEQTGRGEGEHAVLRTGCEARGRANTETSDWELISQEGDRRGGAGCGAQPRVVNVHSPG